jgi:hypothetical protein
MEWMDNKHPNHTDRKLVGRLVRVLTDEDVDEMMGSNSWYCTCHLYLLQLMLMMGCLRRPFEMEHSKSDQSTDPWLESNPNRRFRIDDQDSDEEEEEDLSADDNADVQDNNNNDDTDDVTDTSVSKDSTSVSR